MSLILGLLIFIAAMWTLGALSGAWTLREGVRVDNESLEALRRASEDE